MSEIEKQTEEAKAEALRRWMQDRSGRPLSLGDVAADVLREIGRKIGLVQKW